MDDIKKLLSRYNDATPPEIAIIKDFVRKEFKADVSVTVQPNQIIILAKSAALAGSLRMHLHQLADACKTDKRLVIRIGQ